MGKPKAKVKRQTINDASKGRRAGPKRGKYGGGLRKQWQQQFLL